MKSNYRTFHRTFVLLAVLACFSCAEDESLEYTGKVLDLDTNKPITAATVNLFISDGFGPGSLFRNPVTTTTQSDFQGFYSFKLPTFSESKVHNLSPQKKGYVLDPTHFSTIISDKEDTHHDLYLAKGSFLKLAIKKTSALNAAIIKVGLMSKVSKTDDISGNIYRTENIDIGVLLMDTTLTRGYYFKAAPSVEVSWQVLTDGVVQEYKERVPLTEYTTTHFEINY